MAGEAVKFEIPDIDRLKMVWNKFPRKVEQAVLRPALLAGTLPLLKEYKARANKDLGWVEKTMTRKIKILWNKSRAYAIVANRSRWIPVDKSVRWTKTGKINPAKYAHLTGGDKGPTAEDWMGKGFRAKERTAKDRFFRIFTKNFEKEALKLGFKR